MSQANTTSTRSASAEPSGICRAPASARAAPPMQTRYAFDAAMQRAASYEQPDDERRPIADARAPQGPANTRKPRHTDSEAETDDKLGALSSPNPFAAQTPAHPAAGALAGVHALPGAVMQHMPLPAGHGGLSAESLPGQTAIGGTRQLNLSLPADTAVLNLRLTQANPTHWQLRLGTDAATRQQLAPHVERLRDRLRQRQGNHTADFDLEDESGVG
ncbi:MAG: hypothetical protein Q4F13_03565 [Pseudomonadota bacterium]|nr:hypothetical protein [Pseudomonadota bacterium]